MSTERLHYRRVATLALAALILFGPASAPWARAQEDLEAILRFEVTHPGPTPQGWGGGPPGTVALDDQIVHEGQWAAHLTRDESSPSTFSTLTRRIPVDFAGEKIQLSGWLRSEDVDGFFGLWMREDGPSGSVQFENMQKQGLHGTTGWTRYEIELPLDPDARELYFGALMAGQGQLWIDDLELRVDDAPLAEASTKPIVTTVLDRDQEFDRGSGIEIDRLSPEQIENLALTGRIWGFLKYHHPRITAGELHWDFELFRLLPGLLRVDTPEQRNQLLADWVDALGIPPACERCADAPSDTAALRPDLDWLGDHTLLGPRLSQQLTTIHRRRHTGGDQFYVSIAARGAGNPVFLHEPAYGSAKLDAGFRLLTLFRFWNVVEYWSPYRDQVEEDWEEVLREFVPRIAGAREREDFQLELVALIARLGDGHANLWSSLAVRPPRGNCQLPVTIRYVEERPTVVDRIPVAGPTVTPLEIGDVLVALDGRPVHDLVEIWTPYYAASNDRSRHRDIARSMTRGACGPASVRVARDGELLDLEVERRPLSSLQADRPRTHDRSGETFQRLSDDVVYLKLSSVESDKATDYVRRAQGSRGWILDLRNYPADFVVFALGRHLVAETTPFARFTRGELSNPGAFDWTEPVSLVPAAPHYDGRVVILVDEITQSSAEYHAMAFRTAPGAVVVGSQTAGADGNVSRLTLPGQLHTLISGIGVFYPDQTPTQGVGIVPDVEIRPTRQGMREGRDEVLEEALRQILGDAASQAEIRALGRTD